MTTILSAEYICALEKDLLLVYDALNKTGISNDNYVENTGTKWKVYLLPTIRIYSETFLGVIPNNASTDSTSEERRKSW